MKIKMVKKTVVIGMDGATWDLLKPWADEGKLPVLKNLMENGSYGDLESTIPPVTCPAWVSLLTGKNPGKLGLYYFRQRVKSSYLIEAVKINWKRYNPLWQILNEAGKSVYIINTPTVTPSSENYNGVYISCPIMGDDDNLGYPEFVKDMLKERNYERNAPAVSEVGEEKYLRKVYEITKKKCEIALELLDKKEWDFFMFTIFYTDQIQHFFWKYMDKVHPGYDADSVFGDAILEYFQFVDQYLSRFLDELPDDSILLLVSDHGHGPAYKELNLNLWLEKEGFLCFKRERKVNKKIYNFIRKKPFLLNIAEFMKSSTFLRNIVKKIPDGSIMSRINWNKTIAYNPSPGAIFINLKGREPEGKVERDEYGKIRSEIMKKIKRLEDPESNEPILQKIWGKEDIYRGDYIEYMPDIVLEFKDEQGYINYGFEKHVDKIFSELSPLVLGKEGYTLTSTHTSRGIFLAHGSGVKKGFEVKNAKIYDIVPTILHIFGIPIPKDIDGRVLKEIFDKNSELATREIKYKEMDSEKKRLKEKIGELKARDKT
jgi:predicted AlkP superfamily phosphohydrolase/phosphomutase